MTPPNGAPCPQAVITAGVAALRTYLPGSKEEDARIVAAVYEAMSAAMWQPIESVGDGEPVFVGWEGTGFQATVGHSEFGIWGYLTGDMGFKPFDTPPTHFLPMVYSPPAPPKEQQG